MSRLRAEREALEREKAEVEAQKAANEAAGREARGPREGSRAPEDPARRGRAGDPDVDPAVPGARRAAREARGGLEAEAGPPSRGRLRGRLPRVDPDPRLRRGHQVRRIRLGERGEHAGRPRVRRPLPHLDDPGRRRPRRREGAADLVLGEPEQPQLRRRGRRDRATGRSAPSSRETSPAPPTASASGTPTSSSDGLLAGQTWSTFSDPDADHGDIDFEGVNAENVQRQAQFRYTRRVSPVVLLAGALEYPNSSLTDVDGSIVRGVNQVPDLIVRGTFTPVEDGPACRGRRSSGASAASPRAGRTRSTRRRDGASRRAGRSRSSPGTATTPSRSR